MPHMSRSIGTKVIDFHIHIGLKEHWHPWVHEYQKAANPELYKRYDELIIPKNFAAYLSASGIAKAVILPENCPITTGVVPNEFVLDFCRDQDILIPFCTVNPCLEKDVASILKACIQEGAAGIKLYPSYNHFFPNDKTLWPVYEMAQEHRLPVLLHTGSSVFRGSKIKYANPLHLDEVAVDFPDCILLLAHGGRGLWYETAFFLSRLHPNVFIEISGLPPKNLFRYFPELHKNTDKIVFGSDWPGIKSLDANIDAIRNLDLPEQALEKILFGNAARILGLDEGQNSQED
jgi:predicted TIM-barrel fold metal-dependent hydrolase